MRAFLFGANSQEYYDKCAEMSLVISNIDTCFLPPNTATNFASPLIMRLFASSCNLCFLMYSQIFLVTSVRGIGSAPITAAKTGDKVIGFMKAEFAFLAAGAAFGAAAFTALAGAALATGFFAAAAGFFAAAAGFLAVAIVKPPRENQKIVLHRTSWNTRKNYHTSRSAYSGVDLFGTQVFFRIFVRIFSLIFSLCDIYAVNRAHYGASATRSTRHETLHAAHHFQHATAFELLHHRLHLLELRQHPVHFLNLYAGPRSNAPLA